MSEGLMTYEDAKEKPERFFDTLVQGNLVPKEVIRLLLEGQILSEDPLIAAGELKKGVPLYRRLKNLIVTLTFIVFISFAFVIVWTTMGRTQSLNRALAMILELIGLSVIFEAFLTRKVSEPCSRYDDWKTANQQTVRMAVWNILRVSDELGVWVYGLHTLGLAELKQIAAERVRNLAESVVIGQQNLRTTTREDEVAVKLICERIIGSKDQLREIHLYLATLGLVNKEWDEYWPEQKRKKRQPSLPNMKSEAWKP